MRLPSATLAKSYLRTAPQTRRIDQFCGVVEAPFQEELLGEEILDLTVNAAAPVQIPGSQ
jgi:hypothetical protein